MARTLSLIIPREVRLRGCALLHQQCWLWGQDIRYAKGNLLCKYGFERLRPPSDQTASTQYSLQLDSALIVRLWGFGFAYGTREEQVYVNRYDFRPRLLLNDSDRWEPPDTVVPFAKDSIVLQSAIRWIASYERRIAVDQGKHYRDKLLLQWKKYRKSIRPLTEQWAQLADKLASASLTDSIFRKPRTAKKGLLNSLRSSGVTRSYRTKEPYI